MDFLMQLQGNVDFHCILTANHRDPIQRLPLAESVRSKILTMGLYSGKSDRTHTRLRFLSECLLNELIVLIMPLVARPLSVCRGLYAWPSLLDLNSYPPLLMVTWAALFSCCYSRFRAGEESPSDLRTQRRTKPATLTPAQHAAINNQRSYS